MAVPVARVHLKVAHTALPALLPTPPRCKMMLPLLPTTPCVAARPPKPLANAKPGRADSAERWDARKTKPAGAEPTADIVRSSAGHGSPPPKPGRADSVERWDAHKMAAASQASSAAASSGKWTISRARASSAERWDVHKKERCVPQAKLLDDGDSSSSSGSDDLDTEEDEEIVWKPRAMYAGPGFAVAALESSMLPMPTAFLLPVA